MKGSTQERSNLLAQSVARLSARVPIWRHMKRPTQERSPLLVPNVTSHSQTVLIWSNMKLFTLVKSLLYVPNVTGHSSPMEAWKSMKGSTQEKSNLLAQSVTRLSVRCPFEDTWNTGEEPLACSKCDKSFTVRSHLKNHERIHTGEKPFACPKCEKWFTESGHLKKHERAHTGEKPFACSNVRSHSQKVVISESMKGPTQERSHLPVPNVTSHSITVDSLCFVTKNRHLQFCGLLQFSGQFQGYQFFH